MNYYDLVGAILSLTSTLLFAREKISAWPIGIAACFVNFILYMDRGIFADAYLQIAYSVISLYGWYNWVYGTNESPRLKIRHASVQEVLILGAFGLLTSLVIAYYLSHYTQSSMPYFDAFTTVFSLIGQWLVSKKIIQTWLVWFVVDASYIWIYLQKSIPFHSILLMLYVGIAVWGYMKWARIMSSNNLDPALSADKAVILNQP